MRSRLRRSLGFASKQRPMHVAQKVRSGFGSTTCNNQERGARIRFGAARLKINQGHGMADSPDIIASLDDLAGRYAAILCDVWGVVHNGEWHFPAAAAALARARA